MLDAFFIQKLVRSNIGVQVRGPSAMRRGITHQLLLTCWIIQRSQDFLNLRRARIDGGRELGTAYLE